MYGQMVLARAIDRRMWVLNRQGKAPFVISGQGHEAAQVGAAAALRPGVDWLVPYYRDLAFCIAMGMTPLDFMYSVYARRPDPNSGGRQMPSHFGLEPSRIVSTSSVVATQVAAKVARFTSHSSDDDQRRYRPQDELESLLRRDPIERFRNRLLDDGILDDATDERLQQEATAEVDAAVRTAEAAEMPDPA